MFLALCISGLTALCAGSYQQIINAIIYNKILFYSILVAELIIVVGLIFFLKDIPSPLIPLLFIIYSVLTGLTISVVFLLYTKESIVMTFFISAGIFAVMSIYGYFTKTDLTKLGNVLFLSLIDIIIVSIFNLFLKSSTLDWITSLVSVIIFCGFIAYDTQIIKRKSILRSDGLFGDTTKTTISSALSLYLNFINLFLDLLTLLGKEND
jgi:FtsH-binding integral membrane protein